MSVPVATREELENIWAYIAVLLARIEELERITGENK